MPYMEYEAQNYDPGKDFSHRDVSFYQSGFNDAGFEFVTLPGGIKSVAYFRRKEGGDESGVLALHGTPTAFAYMRVDSSKPIEESDAVTALLKTFPQFKPKIREAK